MTHDDDDLLAGINVHTWRVPPPAPLDRAALLVRALAPAIAPPRRPRLRWLIAGIVLANAALAALIVVVLRRAPETRTVTVLPAGGSASDARVTELLQRLEQDQHELEAKLRETQDLRALVLELQEKARKCEERERTTPKKVESTPAPVPPVTEPPVADPSASCDEVSCVLMNYTNGCCDKYKKSYVPPKAPSGPPESLDRAMISNGIASVKASVAACGGSAKGLVKVHVRVGANGLVTNVEIAATPDARLGACVAGAIQKAVFPRTQNGGSFSYPFVF